MKMKIFTKKFFLLAIGMILSVGASAQEAIHHRFPEVKFMYGGKEYILPAWDVMFGSGDDVSKQRVQAKASWTPNAEGTTVKAKIVSKFGITADEEFFTSFGGSKTAKIQIAKVDEQNNIVTDEEGNIVYNEFSVGTVTYAQACPNYDFSQTSATGYNSSGDGNQKLFFPDSYTLPTGEYTITVEKVFKKVTFEIDEIGAWAYRGQKSGDGFILLKAQKVIIPKEITTIGIGAFSYIMSKEIEFEEGSTITSLTPAIFMCSDLEKITLPASLTEIRGAAFGGMTSLNHIVFTGTTVPTLESDKFEGNTATCDPFTAIPRLSKTNVDPAKCVIEVPLGTVNAYTASNDGYYATKMFPFSSKFPLTTSTGVMTYCSEVDFTFKQYNTSSTSWEAGEMKTYYVKKQDVEVENSRVVLTEVTENVMIPGWAEDNDFGVVLKGTSGTTYDIFYPNGRGMTTTLTMDDTENCLKGCVTPTDVAAGSNENISYYILSDGKFKRISKDGQCKANRAYIMISGGGDIDVPVGSGASQALELSFLSDDTTGITTHEVQKAQNDTWYTLQGTQVNQPIKGIYIKNGKEKN